MSVASRGHGIRPSCSSLYDSTCAFKSLLGVAVRAAVTALVSYKDGSKSVLYYNAETQKILTSRNFRFLEPSIPSLEHLLIMPNDEGESRDAMDIITGMLGEPSSRSLNPLKR